MRALTLSLLFLTVACGGDKDDGNDDVVPQDGDADTDADADADADADVDADTDADTDTDINCDAMITSVEPEANYDLTPIDQTVVVTFDKAITAADPWDVEIAGVIGSAALDPDGMGASFVPDAPLAYDTLYTINASVCADVGSSPFTTLPEPIDDLGLEGNAYGVPFDTLNITEPGNAAALSAVLPIDYLAVQVGAVDPKTSALSAYGAVAIDNGGVPELDCGAAIDGVELDFTLNPYFRMGPTVLTLDVGGGNTIDAVDFELLGRFNADASEINDVAVSALIDLTYQSAPLNCGTVAALAAGTCVACYAGAPTSECLVLEATAPAGFLDPRMDIEATCFSGTTN